MTSTLDIQSMQDGDWTKEQIAERLVQRAKKYTFVSEVVPKVWKVRRNEDWVEFLAQLMPIDASDLEYLMGPTGGDIWASVMTVLNHENLVNIVDRIAIRSMPTPSARLGRAHDEIYLIYDFCNAGTVANIINPREPPKLSFSEQEEENFLERKQEELNKKQGAPLKATREQREQYMPESLCWHVLCSVLSALAWLHHGFRLTKDPMTGEDIFTDSVVDWQTILHRNININTIFFCHPEDKETYGLCKLGDFSKAFISGHFNGIYGMLEPSDVEVLAPRDGHGPLNEVRQLHKAQQTNKYDETPENEKPYTILSEYKALGNVLRVMMMGDQGIPPDEAAARIESMDPDEMDPRDYDNELGYSWNLKMIVYNLLTAREATATSTKDILVFARMQQDNFITSAREGEDMIAREDLAVQQVREQWEKEEQLWYDASYKDWVLDTEDQERFEAAQKDPATSDPMDATLKAISQDLSTLGLVFPPLS